MGSALRQVCRAAGRKRQRCAIGIKACGAAMLLLWSVAAAPSE
jgi:hypothetical protein